MRRLLFWGSAALVVYTYALFPAIVFVRGRLKPQPYRRAPITPRVSLIIAAYNEEQSIGAKLDNVLKLDYPREQLEVLVASDGSDDRTNEIVASYENDIIRLLPLERQGKAGALNAAVAQASGDILVFSDANSMYHPLAIRELVAPFADELVGGVAGNQVYVSASQSEQGEQQYWNFDRKLKQSQSSAGNAISATGAIYAIRRALFQGVPAGVTDDFATSTSVIAQGYRLVFAPDAIAYEPPAESSAREFGRKTRVITRGLRAVILRRELLNPMRYGFYAFQLFSHKVLRRLMVFPLMLIALVSPLLWRTHWLYRLATLLQGAFYGLAALGWYFQGKPLGRKKLLNLPFFFCMVNTASLCAVLNILRGKRIDFWQPQREAVHPTHEHNTSQSEALGL
jgi:cellulose synthase/poly-beta-1,6-N-acetylglucosamine synthase-like glycosyltransferase